MTVGREFVVHSVQGLDFLKSINFTAIGRHGSVQTDLVLTVLGKKITKMTGDKAVFPWNQSLNNLEEFNFFDQGAEGELREFLQPLHQIGIV